MNRNNRFTPILLLLTLLFTVGTAVAQESELSLRLNRDFGYGGFGTIQGKFSYRVTGPDTLSRVEFLLNGEIIGEDSEPPFRFQFHTDDYPMGDTTFSAIGYTTDGQEYHSNEVTREILSKAAAGEETKKAAWQFGLPFLILIGVVYLITIWASRSSGKYKTVTANSFFGATVCPKCGQPFNMHIWKLNLGISALDRCPHCGKWSRVNRATSEEIEAAEQGSITEPSQPASAKELLRKKLDDSRFDE